MVKVVEGVELVELKDLVLAVHLLVVVVICFCC